jgi:predicted nucleic acid-binding protein
MKIVTNAGPLIVLAKINQLSLLEQLFTEVNIPSAVHRELLAKSGPETMRLDEALNRFIQVASPPQLPSEIKTEISHLDSGEQQAVALAYELKKLLVIDDRLGRAAARQLNISITGTAGIMLRAKNAGLISDVRPLLNEARQQGYWLSDAFLDIVTKLAGETKV